MEDLAARVHEAHVRRLAAIDPAVHLVTLDLATEGREVLLADDGEAVAVVDSQHTDPMSEPGLWVEDDVHRVQVRCTADVGPAALTDLLRRAFTALGQDRRAHLSVASRDVPLVRPLLRAGFAPNSVLALHRLAARPVAQDEDEVSVRPATSGDVEAIVAASVAVQSFDSAIGVLPERPRASEVFRPTVEAALRDHAGWAWVAERAGVVVGVCVMEPPETAGWVTESVNAPADGSATAYLAMLHVTPGERGRGVGARLVQVAHARSATAGVGQVLLHHAALNPLSVPFWGRVGYRPLLTGWTRFPA